MITNKEKIIALIQENGQASVAFLEGELLIGRVMIHRHLKLLVEKGILRKIGTPPRVVYASVRKNVSVSKKSVSEVKVRIRKAVPNFISLPVVASAGCDEGNVFAEERIEEYVTMDRSFLPKGKTENDVAVVRAVGDSMNDAGIQNGDYVLVEKLCPGEARENERVIALVNNTLVIKSIHFTPNAVVLRPQSKNNQYRPIIARKDVTIPGRIIDVVRMSSEERYEKIV